jgi:Kef-type K+ transport system membrane component KefB
MPHTPLLLQLVVILGTARFLSFVLRRLGQPPVIGEMAAGIVLGPIVFGALAPGLHARVFTPESLPVLDGLAELGLVLFMFIVGAELRLPAGARRQVMAAGSIALSSVLIPMAIGLCVAVALYPGLAPPGVAFWPFALFMASAMSVTAFPVMARILRERGLTQSMVGRLALTSAAVADVLTWIVLALVVVLAGAGRDWSRFWQMLLGLGVFVGVVLGIMPPLLARLIERLTRDGSSSGPLLALLMIGTFACALATELLGIHPVFGAFLFGAALPRDDRLLATLVERIEHVAVLVLMPIFFALAGLLTTSDALVGSGLAATALVFVAAVAGKLAGGALGARAGGLPWRTAFAIGSLMNTRGLMELVVMKVGLDIGVIGPELFTMLMLMAILTTLMTSPLLSLLGMGEAGR